MVALVVASGSYRGASWAEGVQYWYQQAARPLLFLVNAPIDIYSGTRTMLQEKHELIAENTSLRVEVQQLRAHIQTLTALKVENEALRKLWLAKRNDGRYYQVAMLSAVSLDPNRQWYVLEQGKSQGLKVGYAVIDAYGVIGQIIKANATRSVVMLLSDPESALPVDVGDHAWRAIAVGTGQMRRLRLLYVPDTADIKVGDAVRVASIAEEFPAGYPIGRVVAIERSADNMYTAIDVVASAHLSRSDVVMVTHSKKADKA